MNTRAPYKVIVWGTGSVGKVCLREIVNRPEFELVGVFGYRPDKIGKDAGEVIGQAPVGVKINNDVDAMLATSADCVLWCAGFPIGSIGRKMEETVPRLLASGKNVITCAAHHYPPARGSQYATRLEDACLTGGSSLHGTGENPGFWLERVAVTLTGCTSRVHSLTLSEYADVAKPSEGGNPSIMGFSLTKEQATQPGPISKVWENYYFEEAVQLASLALFGKPLERFAIDPVLTLAEADVVLDKAKGDPIDFKVPQGHVLAITNNYRGFVDGENKLTISGNWFLTEKYSPFHGKKDSMWDIEIEGDPVSLACNINAFASLRERRLYRPGDTTTPTWSVTGITMVQAIPRVVAAPPGFVYASVFAHSSPDYRLLENRASIVG